MCSSDTDDLFTDDLEKVAEEFTAATKEFEDRRSKVNTNK